MFVRNIFPVILLVGIVSFLISFAILSLTKLQIAEQLIISFVISILVSCIVSGIWQRRKNRDSYQQRSHRLRSKIMQSVVEIQKFAPRIRDMETSLIVEDLCTDVKMFVYKLEEKAPNSRLSVMTILSANLVLIKRDILPQYLDLQDHGRYFDNPEQGLRKAYESMKHFDEHIVTNVGLLELGDETNFNAAVALLDPTQRTSIN